jgi:hypothetical protein
MTPVQATILTAVISASIPAIGSIIVTVISNKAMLKKTHESNTENWKLVEYRIGQLEEKVNKHNNLIERTYRLESKVDAIENRLNA